MRADAVLFKSDIKLKGRDGRAAAVEVDVEIVAHVEYRFGFLCSLHCGNSKIFARGDVVYLNDVVISSPEAMKLPEAKL